MAKIENMQQANDTNANVNEEIAEAKKPNVFKRAWTGVKSGIRKLRESPVANTIFGCVVGIGATLGAQALMAKRGHSDAIPIGMLEAGEDEDYAVLDPAEAEEIEEAE